MRRSQAILENLLHISAPVKNGNLLQWFRVGPINDEVRINRKELHELVGQILAPMPSAGVFCQKDNLIPDDRFNTIRHFGRTLSLDVAPDFNKIECGFGRK